jgi:hypothetical protein
MHMRRTAAVVAVLACTLLQCTPSEAPPPSAAGPSAPPAAAPAIPPSFDFACDTGTATLAHPARAGVSCVVTPRNGFKSTVTLSCANEPAWVECGFDPAQLDFSGTDPRTVTFGFRQMNLRAEPDTYTVKATAHSGELTRSANASVAIAEGCAGFKTEPSYTGCASRPPGTSCAVFSDGYVWLARRGVVGWRDAATCEGRTVEVMIGGGEVHHILGTDWVRVR